MKAILVVFALLASACALQYPLEYHYHYEGRLAMGIPGLRAQVSALGIKARVTLQMISKSEGHVKLTDVQVAEFNDDLQCVQLRQPVPFRWSPIPEYKEQIEKAFSVDFRQEMDHVMSVPSSDLEWITNIRKSIVEALRLEPVVANLGGIKGDHLANLVTGGNAPDAFSMEEETIFGRCETQYSVTKLPSYLAQEEKKEMKKYLKEDYQMEGAPKTAGAKIPILTEEYYRLVRAVNFDKCHDRVILQHAGVANMSRAGHAQFRTVQSRSSVGTFLLKGKPGAFRVERAIIEGDVIANPLGFKTHRMQTITNQTLILEAATPIQSQMALPNPIHSVKTWRFAVASPFSAPEGHPKPWINYYNKNDKYFPVAPETTYLGVFPHPPFNQENKKNILEMLDSIVREVYSEPSEPMRTPSFKSTKSSLATTQLYLVTKMMRVIPLETVKEIFSEIFSQKDIMSQRKQTVLVDVAAASGASAAIKVLIEKMKKQEISHQRMGSIFMTLPNNLLAPSVIPDLMEYVKSIDIENNPILASSALVNFASLAERICINQKKSNYSVPNPVFGRESCKPSKIMNEFLPYLKEKAKSASKSWERAIILQAISNLGSPAVLPVLRPYIFGQIDSNPRVRSVAIYGLVKRRMTDSARERVFDILMAVVDNLEEQPEIRQAAFFALRTWNPDAAWWQRMARMTWREPSQSMAAYITFTAESLARSTEPHLLKQASIAAFVLPLMKPFSPSTKYSYNYIYSRFDYVSKVGVEAEASYIHPLREVIPTEIYTSIKENFGELRFDLYEAAISSKGLSQSVLELMNSLQGSNSGGKSVVPTSVKDPSFRRVSSSKNSEDNDHKEANIYLRAFENMYQYLPLHPDVISKIAGHGGSTFLSKLIHGHKLNMTKFMNPIDMEYFIPTEIGLPLIGLVAMPTMSVAEAEVKLVTSDESHPTIKSLLKAKNVTLLIKANYKYMSKLIVKMQVPAPWNKKWIETGIENMKEINLPVYGNLTFMHTSELKNITLNLAPFVDRKFPVAHAHNIPFTQIRDMIPTAECRSDYKVIAVEKNRTPALKVHKEFPKKYTGLSVELNYDADVPYPFTFAYAMEYLRRPERWGKLLTSPTVKQWQYSWNLIPSSTSRNISVALSYLTPSADHAKSERSVPDFSPDDTISQRMDKFRSFSEGSKVHGVNAQLFFNGSEFRKYEALFAVTRKDQSQKKIDYKAVIAFLANHIPDVNESPKCLCSEAEFSTPAIIDFTSLQSMMQSHIEETAQGKLYYGRSCKAPVISKFSGWSKVSESRRNLIASELKKICNYDHENPTVELQTAAVYDEAHMEIEFSKEIMPKSLLNFTYFIQDNLEGYFYPRASFNNMHKGAENKIVVDVKRPLSSERYSIWADLPQKKSMISEVHVPYFVSKIVPWNILKTSFSRSSNLLIATTNVGNCYIRTSDITTYDGLHFKYDPLACWTVAAVNSQEKDNFKVYTRLRPSGGFETRILMPKDNVEVVASKTSAIINGKPMPANEMTHNVTNSRNELVLQVIREPTLFNVVVIGKLSVTVEDKVIVYPQGTMRRVLSGMCGDFDGAPLYDRTGPEGCIYTNNTLFKYSWTIAEADGCDKEDVEHNREIVEEFQASCNHRPNSGEFDFRSVYESKEENCYKPIYPLKVKGNEWCVSKDPVHMCTEACSRYAKQQISVKAKCWYGSHVPKEVRDAESKGYLSHPVNEPAKVTITIKVKDDTDCRMK